MSPQNGGSSFSAVKVAVFGKPQVMQMKTIPIGSGRVGENQILVKVYAAGVNPVDTYIRAGTYACLPDLPFTPGCELAGEVTQTGSNVKKFKKGDRVFCYKAATGAYSQYAVVDACQADKLPDTISYAQGAAVGTAYRTAFRALIHKGKAKPGQSVLVHGASGGVGLACVQMARAYGLTVYGTAGTSKGRKLLIKQGCAAALSHKTSSRVKDLCNLSGGGVDLIIEMLADKNLSMDMEMLKQGGTIVVVGNRGTIEVNPRLLMEKESSIVGCLGWGTCQEQCESRKAILNGLGNGSLNPVVGEVFPLCKAADAHVEVIAHKNGSSGKIVLEPWEAGSSGRKKVVQVTPGAE